MNFNESKIKIKFFVTQILFLYRSLLSFEILRGFISTSLKFRIFCKNLSTRKKILAIIYPRQNLSMDSYTYLSQ